MFNYKVRAKKGRARVGEFTTLHGIIKTPVFMAVGTVGAVKTVAPWELKQLGADVVLGNTYHLMLRPGEALIKKAGGLHQFMKWDRPILTDSGGFQVFSLGGKMNIDNDNGRKTNNIKPAQITDDGVFFYSHIDGIKMWLDAERSIDIQQQLGADIIMAFDECPPGDASVEYIEQAVMRTHNWLDRSVRAWTNRKNQALFGIVQGATNRHLREMSAKYINDQDLPGNAIGGVSVGESRNKVWQAVKWSVPLLAENKPRYLMGVGEPSDIITAVGLGIDMFDCVLPTRLARHGQLWVTADTKQATCLKKAVLPNGKMFEYKRIDIRLNKFKNDLKPIDVNCSCPACSNGFSRAYLRHLLNENEVLGIRLLTLHNLNFIYRLMETLQQSINS